MNPELEKLIAEQKADDTDYISTDGREVSMPLGKLVRLADNIQIKHRRKGRISWGGPAKNAACQDSNECGVCPAKEPVYDHCQLVAGIDFIREGNRIASALCADCNWSL